MMFKRKRKKLFVFFRNFFQNKLIIHKLSSIFFARESAPRYSFFAFLTADGSIVSLAHFLRKISAEHVARAGGKKDAGGEFDSLSAPPPAVPRLQPHAL